jgi:hypothetical protein
MPVLESRLRILLLLGLESLSSGFNKGCLNWAGNIGREDWSRIQRARNRFFPSLEHLIKLSPNLRVNLCVG